MMHVPSYKQIANVCFANVCFFYDQTLMQGIRKGLFIGFIVLGLTMNPLNHLSTMSSPCTEEAHETTTAIPAQDQTAITKIKSEKIEAGSMVSEHVNEKENGQTTVKMLEIPEHQLSDIISQWEELGHEIKDDTIHDEKFIKYIVSKADIRFISYTVKIPKLFFLVRKEIAEPLLYGGEIKKFFKTITFHGWFKVAGAIDDQGNYKEGFEHLDTKKEEIVDLFKDVLSETEKGCYSIVELYTDESGERKGRFKFFNCHEQKEPTFVRPIDAMAAFGLIYMNLVQNNPGDIGVKEDLTKPIVEKLAAKAG